MEHLTVNEYCQFGIALDDMPGTVNAPTPPSGSFRNPVRESSKHTVWGKGNLTTSITF